MRKNNTPQSAAGYIFECTMAVLYLAIAYAFAFTAIFSKAIPDSNLRLIIGALLGAYGLYRIYRAFRKFKNRNKD